MPLPEEPGVTLNSSSLASGAKYRVCRDPEASTIEMEFNELRYSTTVPGFEAGTLPDDSTRLPDVLVFTQ